MPEYIDRDAVYHVISVDCALNIYEKAYCLDIVRKITSADVAPVRHGHWKYYKKQGIAVCTECSFERKLDDNFGRAVSCPNCGAKMDGGNDNG